MKKRQLITSFFLAFALVISGKEQTISHKMTYHDPRLKKVVQVVIELLQPVSEGTSWKEWLDKKGEGVEHLGFQIVDPDKTSAEHDKAGIWCSIRVDMIHLTVLISIMTHWRLWGL